MEKSTVKTNTVANKFKMFSFSDQLHYLFLKVHIIFTLWCTTTLGIFYGNRQLLNACGRKVILVPYKINPFLIVLQNYSNANGFAKNVNVI